MRFSIMYFGTLAACAYAMPPPVAGPNSRPRIPPPIVDGPPMTCVCYPGQRRKRCCHIEGEEEGCKDIFEPECDNDVSDMFPEPINSTSSSASFATTIKLPILEDLSGSTGVTVTPFPSAPVAKTGLVTMPFTSNRTAASSKCIIITSKTQVNAKETLASPTAPLSEALKGAAQGRQEKDEQQDEISSDNLTNNDDDDNNMSIFEPPNAKMCVCDRDRVGIAWCCVTNRGCKYERLTSCDPGMAPLGAFEVDDRGMDDAAETWSEPGSVDTGKPIVDPWRVCECANKGNIRCCLVGLLPGASECWTDRVRSCRRKHPTQTVEEISPTSR